MERSENGLNNLPLAVDRGSAQGNQVAVYQERYDVDIDEDQIDLRALWKILYRHRKLIALIFAMIFLTALAMTMMQRPVYTSTVLMEINTADRNLVKFEAVDNQKNRSNRYLVTQSEILSSDAVSTEVIRRLNLVAESEFNGKLNQRGIRVGLNSLKKMVKSLVSDEGGSVLLNEVGTQNIWIKRALAKYRGRLVVKKVPGSSLVSVSVSSFSPALAEKMANEHADAFVWITDDRKFNSNSSAKAFLEREITSMQEKLEKSEKRLTAFARKNKVIDVEDSNNIILTRINDLNTSLSEVQNARIDAEAVYSQVRSGHLQGLGLESSSGDSGSLSAQLADAQTEYLQLSQKFKPKYPAMVQVQTRIDELKQLIVRRSKSNLEQLVEREKRLNEALEKLKGELLDLQDRAVSYNLLKREWEANKGLYAGLLERAKEVGVAGGVALNVASVVDMARLGTKTSPQLKRTMLLATLLGLAAGVGVAFLIAMFDNAINDPDKLQELTGLSSLVSIPEVDEGVESRTETALDFYGLQNPSSGFTEAINSLRTSLSYARAGGFPKSIVVVSSTQGEGKSTIAVNLATLCAKAGQKVVLIDADIRRSTLFEALGVSQSPGLSDYLVGTGEIKKYFIQEPVPMSMVVAGQPSPNPVDLLNSSRMRELINDCEKAFDVVIIDSPPVLGLADALVLSSIAKSTLFVVSAHATTKDVIKSALKRLAAVGAPIIGTVLNKCDAEIIGYEDSYYQYSEKPVTKKRLKLLG